jgi:hypothetical protein
MRSRAKRGWKESSEFVEIQCKHLVVSAPSINKH